MVIGLTAWAKSLGPAKAGGWERWAGLPKKENLDQKG